MVQLLFSFFAHRVSLCVCVRSYFFPSVLCVCFVSLSLVQFLCRVFVFGRFFVCCLCPGSKAFSRSHSLRIFETFSIENCTLQIRLVIKIFPVLYSISFVNLTDCSFRAFVRYTKREIGFTLVRSTFSYFN